MQHLSVFALALVLATGGAMAQGSGGGAGGGGGGGSGGAAGGAAGSGAGNSGGGTESNSKGTSTGKDALRVPRKQIAQPITKLVVVGRSRNFKPPVNNSTQAVAPVEYFWPASCRGPFFAGPLLTASRTCYRRLLTSRSKDEQAFERPDGSRFFDSYTQSPSKQLQAFSIGLRCGLQRHEQ